MQPFQSTETRWFFSQTAHDAETYRNWFLQLPDAQIVEQPERTDHYYRLANSPQFGIKLRGEGTHGKIETKEQMQSDGLVHFSENMAGEVQHWIKWSFPVTAELDFELSLFEKNWLAVHKKRWLCVLEILSTDEPGDEVRFCDPSLRISEGLQVEFSEVRTGKEAWFSIGLEAFGFPTLLRANLDAGAHFLAGALSGIRLPATHSMSYYHWLARQAP